MVNKRFIQGVGIGLAAGAAIGMMMPPRKKKSVAGKAIKAVGEVVENMMHM